MNIRVGQRRSVTVASHVGAFSAFHGIKVKPSSLWMSSGKIADGSLETGTPAEAQARAMMSLSAWCRWMRPGACLHTKGCRPHASTSCPQWQERGTQTFSPRRSATATRTTSSSRCKPHAAIGRADSQSPVWGAVAAKNVAF